MNKKYSDYVVYVDESGDHGLLTIDPEYPIFVLSLCIFKKDDYSKTVEQFQKFKFKHFGHDIVILHENEIRRDRGIFSKFKTKDLKNEFIIELTNIIKQQNFTIIATVIDKKALTKKYANAHNPYNIAMKFCLERLDKFLMNKVKNDEQTHIIFEQRGRQEDNELELEFRRVCNNKSFNFNIVMANKQCNSTGLQLADLTARPIGINYIRPQQANKAFEVIEQKFRKINGKYERFGLKIFP
jgi:hypothetical protein